MLFQWERIASGIYRTVSILILKILVIAKGGQADAAGALSEALRSKSLAALMVQCETEAGAGPDRDWQKCSIAILRLRRTTSTSLGAEGQGQPQLKRHRAVI